MIYNCQDFVVRGKQCGTECASLMHCTDCSNVGAAGTRTLDGNFSVPQGAAPRDGTDLVYESPFQSIYSIYVQLLV